MGNGFSFDWRPTLAEGIAALDAGSIDVALSDLGLPDSEGGETTKRCRAQADLPIVVLAGFPDPATAAAARKVGASAYLIKGGVSPTQLHESLCRAIDNPERESHVCP